MDTSARLAVIPVIAPADAVWPAGKTTESWSSFDDRGTKHTLSALTPIEQQLAWLRRIRPRYLSTVVTNLHDLAAIADAADGEIGIEATVVTGSALPPYTREMAMSAFGARVIETYGSNEVGLIAIQCPESELLHICAEHLIVEVVDDDDNPVEPGGVGRVVVTALYNFATPLLRYDVAIWLKLRSSYARVDAHCRRFGG